MLDEPVLSLITGTLNRRESFLRLVDSIFRHTSVSFEIVISDASDETNVIADPRVRIIPEKPRLGCTRGFNRAFREARGIWCLYLNDDSEVLADYDTEAISFMLAHPQIGLGALPYSNRGGPFGVNRYADMIYANFGIIRRSLGDAVGWFDEEFVMYGCDNTINFRVLLADYGVAEIPRARIIHHEVDDIHRRENQHGRYTESDRLKAKYFPRKAEMLKTYESKLALL